MMLKPTPQVNKIICEKIHGGPGLDRGLGFDLVHFTFLLHHRDDSVQAIQQAETHEHTG